MIIGIAGKKGSGKDTAGQYLISKHEFRRYAFGDPVKEVCRLLFGFTDEQLYGTQKEEMTELGIRPREAFQKIGTDFGRNYLHNLLPELKVKNLKNPTQKRKLKNLFRDLRELFLRVHLCMVLEINTNMCH